MSSDENYIDLTGVVESICRDKFTVVINDTDNMMVICTVSGKIRQSGIRILAGDSVNLKVSAYDTGKGRIIYRNKSV